MFTTAKYRLINKQGFINADIANLNLANEIESTGGTIVVKKVVNGAAVGVVYADGSYNDWACIWANESRFFKLDVYTEETQQVQKDKDFIGLADSFKKGLTGFLEHQGNPTRDFTGNLTQHLG